MMMYLKQNNMQLTSLNMINNAIQTAKFKLSQHRVQGENSELSIFQVAKLLDTIKMGERTEESKASIYFSVN